MGGVDKMDSLVGFYRIFIRSQKWYLRIFFHFMDVALANAWLLYRRDLKLCSPRAKWMSLYDFKLQVSEVLRKQNQPIIKIRGAGRPRNPAPKRARRGHRLPNVPLPPDAVRMDKIDHLPALGSRTRCKNEDCSAHSNIYCLKCRAYLCLNKNRNCFADFHGVDPSQ